MADPDRRRAFEAMRDAEPCPACSHAEQGGPITMDHAACHRCDWRGSGTYLHYCRTGWREPLCGACNARAPTAPFTRHNAPTD